MKYTINEHQGQWFIQGPNGYVVRTGYGDRGRRYATFAQHVWNFDDFDDRIRTSSRLQNADHTQQHRAVQSSEGLWSVLWGLDPVIVTGTGKRGEYHARMLSYCANGLFGQASWYHESSEYGRTYVRYALPSGHVLLDVDLDDYDDNVFVRALSTGSGPAYDLAKALIDRKVLDRYHDILVGPDEIDEMRIHMQSLLARTYAYNTIEEAHYHILSRNQDEDLFLAMNGNSHTVAASAGSLKANDLIWGGYRLP